MTKRSLSLIVGVLASYVMPTVFALVPMRPSTERLQCFHPTRNFPLSKVFLADDVIPEEPPTMEVPVTFMLSSTKFRRLKDLMWIRETLEDLTTAEFASSLDAKQEEGQRKRKRAVDYDKLLGQLNNRLKDLGCFIDGGENQCTKPVPGKGMGLLVYSDEQREALYTRILKTRHALINAMQNANEMSDDLVPSMELSLPDIPFNLPEEPRLYVREDGLADWDGALQDRAAMRAFGTAVWARINGMDPDKVLQEEENDVSKHEGKSVVTAKIEDTDEIREQRARLEILEAELETMTKQHTELLKSAISAGQAVANINLANLDQTLRAKIETSRLELEKKKEEFSYQSLLYELERIYTYLSGELESAVTSGYIPIQDRLNVAEFGLLESQVATFEPFVKAGQIIDPDVLKVVLDSLADFKSRLGIDYYVTGVSFDREAIQRWLGIQWARTQEGLAFYGKGIRLLAGDVAFCLNLFARALQGYTLKPREVRYLRRTLKDVTNFIPFIIILIIPLSPIGHIVVFGAIQKWYPDFFPSCFTERRQNLLRLYETTEYSEVTINENWRAKMSRFTEACAFLLVNGARSIYLKLTGAGENDEESPTNGQ